MNWRSVNFDWNRARAFLITAEEGSYSAAAKELKLAQPTLGRQVAALEKELGVVLFEKVGNSLKLTPSGFELLEHVKKMAEAASQLSLRASGKSMDVEGSVCISASESFAVYLLPKILIKLRKEQPKIHFEIIASNESSDLIRREADIALRNYRPTQPDLIAKKINEARFSMYATPAYLEKIGSPKEIEDLARAQFIGFDKNENVVREFARYGLHVTPKNFPYITHSHIAHWELTKLGAAIGLMATTIGDQDPDVVKVLPGKFPPMIYENWLVSHRELKTSRRIKMVFDFLYEELSKVLSG